MWAKFQQKLQQLILPNHCALRDQRVSDGLICQPCSKSLVINTPSVLALCAGPACSTTQLRSPGGLPRTFNRQFENTKSLMSSPKGTSKDCEKIAMIGLNLRVDFNYFQFLQL
jgi:hypothetical protein